MLNYTEKKEGQEPQLRDSMACALVLHDPASPGVFLLLRWSLDAPLTPQRPSLESTVGLTEISKQNGERDSVGTPISR